MAPELIKGEKYSTKIDIYALGCIIYELFTLNVYYLDKIIFEKECKIENLYDKKWQELIDLLLNKDYHKRLNIDEVNKYLNKNEIELTLEIDKFDINKKIYFIDNTPYHDKIKEMNKLNTKIYINDKYQKYKKYFIPKKEGIYSIKLIFNFLIKDCSYMFYNVKQLISVDLSSFDTTNIINMEYMFSGCDYLKSFNLPLFAPKQDIKNIGMFSGFQNSKYIYFSDDNKIEIKKEITSLNNNRYSKEENKRIKQFNKISEYINHFNSDDLTNKQDSKELEFFYDMIININSIKDIEKGWLIKMSEKGEINYNKYKNKNLITIGVIGNSYKGKSFILSKIISKAISLSDSYIKTEGLCVKYSELEEEFINNKIVLLDSPGIDTPILNEREGDNKYKDKNKNNKIKEIDDKEIFDEKLRVKLVTKLFLQNFIINNSDILLIVVGLLTFSEQKLLHRIKMAFPKMKLLYIIHNLKEFTSINQVQNYIKKYLKKSSTFKLEDRHIISTLSIEQNGCYFYEENSNFNVFHYIFAKEGSEAGNFYNQFVIDTIRKTFIIPRANPFDFFQTIKKSFIEFSPGFFNNESPFVIDDFISNDEIIKNKIIKFKKPKSLNIKKLLSLERGLIINRGIKVNYNIYKKDNELIVRVEVPGNCNIKTNIDFFGEYNFIRIEGEKTRDKEPPQDNENINSTREYGKFYLDIPLKEEDFNIKNESPIIDYKRGIFIIRYKLEEQNNIGMIAEFKDEDEI